MKPYPVTVHFLNTNKRKQFSATFDNIGAARTFISFAPITCVNFVVVNAKTLEEIERHRFEQLPLQTQESEPLPMGDVNQWVDQIKQTHPENHPAPVGEIVDEDPIGLALQEPPTIREVENDPPLLPDTPVVEMMTQQQQRALFGVVMPEYAKRKQLTLRDAQLELKALLIKRGMIKVSRTELTKADASKVIDGMCKMLSLELDSSWL